MLPVVFRPMKTSRRAMKKLPLFLLFPRPFAILFLFTCLPFSPTVSQLGAARENHLWGHCQARCVQPGLKPAKPREFLLGSRKIMGRGVSLKHLSSLRNGPRQPRKLQPRGNLNSAKMTTGCNTFSLLNEARAIFC
jgi:hypothetical protein